MCPVRRQEALNIGIALLGAHALGVPLQAQIFAEDRRDKQRERRRSEKSVSGGLGGSNYGGERGEGNSNCGERDDGNNSGEEGAAAAYSSDPVRDFRVVQF